MKILILGAGGRLGAALMRAYREKFEVSGFDRTQVDLANLEVVRGKLRSSEFDLLINAAAFTNVDLCETHREQAFRINAEAPRILAEICGEKSARLIHFSTDYVFDGKKREPYGEEDECRPISVYGESKLAGEKNVLSAHRRNLVVRVSWVFGPDRPSFIDAMIQQAQETENVDAVSEKFSTPTYTFDIAEMLPRFFSAENVDAANPAAANRGGHRAADYGGILHFANKGECNWQEYAQWAVDCCRDSGLSLKAKRIGARKLRDMAKWVARRPVYSVLSTAKYTKLTGTSPRTWRDAVSDYITRFYSKK